MERAWWQGAGLTAFLVGGSLALLSASAFLDFTSDLPTPEDRGGVLVLPEDTHRHVSDRPVRTLRLPPSRPRPERTSSSPPVRPSSSDGSSPTTTVEAPGPIRRPSPPPSPEPGPVVTVPPEVPPAARPPLAPALPPPGGAVGATVGSLVEGLGTVAQDATAEVGRVIDRTLPPGV